jgi:hypothetical protein
MHRPCQHQLTYTEVVVSRTTFLARLIGVYCIVVAVALTTHMQASLVALDAIVHSPDILLVAGVLALLGGLAMVIGHNIWSGGARAVVVTLIGWLMLLRALLLLFLPGDAVAALYSAMHVEQWFYVYVAITAAIGVYLTYVSFAVQAPPAPDRR